MQAHLMQCDVGLGPSPDDVGPGDLAIPL